MRLQTELVKISSIDDSFTADFQWRIAIERRMYTMTWIISGEGPFGPGLPFLRGENSGWYLRFLSASWNFRSVEGLMTTATFESRRGLINSDYKPNRNRSRVVRLGARRRERLMTRSCCFRRRFSAITALALPCPRCFATAVNKCARSSRRFFIIGKGRGNSHPARAYSSIGFYVRI
jgi:hypothetical protein